MKRVKERWDLEFPEQASVRIHNLRNNASRFQRGIQEYKEFNLNKNRNETDQQQNRVNEDHRRKRMA